MIEVCDLADLPPGAVAVALVEGPGGPLRIAVFNDEGELHAIDDRCTHQEAYLSDGWLEGGEVECPLHSACFDLRTGQPTGPPATLPVRVYRAEVRGGRVWVDPVPPVAGGTR